MRALTGFTDKRRVGVLVVTILVTVGLTNAGVAWASLTWTTKAPMPTGRQLVSVASNHGIIYALGGNDVESDTATFTDANEAYDPASNTWSTKAQIPQRVASLNSAVSGSDGRIYLLNAENLAGGLASYAYTPATDSWDPVPQMPGAADDGAAVSTGGLIYYIGGFYNGSQSNASNELHVYTIATKTWKTLAPMPTARALLAAAVVGGRIYAIGGCPGSCGSASFYSTVERYTISTNRWKTVAKLPVPTIELAAKPGPNGRIYAIGGQTSSGLTGAVSIYTPSENRWRTGPTMHTPRAALGVARVGTNLYAIGGVDCCSSEWSHANERLTLG